MIEVISAVICLAGSLFLLLASLGLVRMPDVYNRMQAGTKATTLGTILFLTGIIVSHPRWWSKILLIILFIVVTNPLSSHVLARAIHFTGKPLAKKEVKDDLKDDYPREGAPGSAQKEETS